MREREEGERGGRRGKEEKEGIMEGRAVGKEGRKEEETAVQPERVLIHKTILPKTIQPVNKRCEDHKSSPSAKSSGKRATGIWQKQRGKSSKARPATYPLCLG